MLELSVRETLRAELVRQHWSPASQGLNQGLFEIDGECLCPLSSRDYKLHNGPRPSLLGSGKVVFLIYLNRYDVPYLVIFSQVCHRSLFLHEPRHSKVQTAVETDGLEIPTDRRWKDEFYLLNKGLDDSPLSKAVLFVQQTLVKIRISLAKFSWLVDLGTKVMPIVLIYQIALWPSRFLGCWLTTPFSLFLLIRAACLWISRRWILFLYWI